MKFKGGYNVLLEGKPSAEVQEIPAPETLFVPLFSRRFDFSEICVEDGAKVRQGDVLARDPGNYSLPLLAARGGTVRLDPEIPVITLEDLQADAPEAVDAGKGVEGLVRLGAWRFFSDALTGDLPDPAVAPQAVVISTFQLDPFVVRGDVRLRDHTDDLAACLGQLNSLLTDQPVYVVVPDIQSELAGQVCEEARRHDRVTVCNVPLRYPFGNTRLMAQKLGLDKTPEKGPVWGLGVEGLMAVGEVLATSKPSVSQTIAIGGPAATNPTHVVALVGYPIKAICDAYMEGSPVRVVNGGVLSGRTVSDGQSGVDMECLGLTMIPENTEREVLAFAHLGFGKHAFTRTFASAIRPFFRENYSTALRGEHRPCVSCGSCEKACAAGLMPFLISRYAAKNRLEEARKVGLDTCVNCGLCSHVCLAKRETSQTIFDGQEAARQEDAKLKEHS